jgi:hypothetical protein
MSKCLRLWVGQTPRQVPKFYSLSQLISLQKRASP